MPGPRNVPAKIAAKRPVQVISWDECVDRLANSKRRRTDDDFTLVLESGGSFESDLESNLESDSGSDLESSNEEDNEDDDEADPHHAAAALSSPAWAPGNSPVPQHVNQIATTLQLKVHLKSALDFISKRGLVSGLFKMFAESSSALAELFPRSATRSRPLAHDHTQGSSFPVKEHPEEY